MFGALNLGIVINALDGIIGYEKILITWDR